MKNSDLMEYLGCSYSTIENLRNAGKIPYKKVMGTYYYSFEEVSKVFEQGMN
jgi:predicted site-specific integrase-resolvase